MTLISEGNPPDNRALPYSTDLWRWKECKVQKRHIRDAFVAGVLNRAGVETHDGVWSIVYGSKLKPYQPDDDVLKDALALHDQLPDCEDDRPSDECLEFFKKWGPLGLYGMRQADIVWKDQHWVVRLKLTNDKCDILSDRNEVTLQEYVKLFHSRTVKVSHERYLRLLDLPTDNYIEFWPVVYSCIRRFNGAIEQWRESRNIHELDELFSGNVRLGLRTHNGESGFVQRFTSLHDAIVGLFAEQTMHQELKRCPTCKELFWTPNPIQMYCKPDHQRNRPKTALDPERDALLKEKKRLRSIMHRREINREVTESESNLIRHNIGTASDLTNLNRAMKPWQELLETRPRGPRRTKREGVK
jgi:hypothetical protein